MQRLMIVIEILTCAANSEIMLSTSCIYVGHLKTNQIIIFYYISILNNPLQLLQTQSLTCTAYFKECCL